MEVYFMYTSRRYTLLSRQLCRNTNATLILPVLRLEYSARTNGLPWLLIPLISPYSQQLSGYWLYIWWRHQMETFSALLAICAGNSPGTGEFPAQRPVTRSFDVFFDLRPNKRLSKQWWGWWFETPSCPLWRHCNDKKDRPVYPHRRI